MHKQEMSFHLSSSNDVSKFLVYVLQFFIKFLPIVFSLMLPYMELYSQFYFQITLIRLIWGYRSCILQSCLFILTFFVGSLGFSTYKIMTILLLLSFQAQYLISFSFPIGLAGTSGKMLNKSAKSGPPVLFLVFVGEATSYSL